MKPRLLDLFCGAGGCSVGYARAGFEVVGVDIETHPDYPFPMFVSDAISFAQTWLNAGNFDAVHASPPCPRYSAATPAENRDKHPDLVAPVRELLRDWGGAYVIENVPGAPLENPLTLCGSTFGLGVRRHRLFENQRADAATRVRPPIPAAGLGRLRRPRRPQPRNAPRWHQSRQQGPRRSTRTRGHGHRLDDPVGRPGRRDPSGLHRVHRPRARRPPRERGGGVSTHQLMVITSVQGYCRCGQWGMASDGGIARLRELHAEHVAGGAS